MNEELKKIVVLGISLYVDGDYTTQRMHLNLKLTIDDIDKLGRLNFVSYNPESLNIEININGIVMGYELLDCITAVNAILSKYEVVRYP